jgi:outer membrane protein OmpA-like peptidoglycan-associated protein
MRIPSAGTKFFRAPQTILLLGVVMLQCASVIAQTQPDSNPKRDLFTRLRLHSASTAPAATCSVQPNEVLVGEPATATVTSSAFNRKHTLSYVWYPSDGGGKVIGRDATAQITTTDAAPGSYTVTVYVTDDNRKKDNEVTCSADFTVKPVPPKNPPTISLTVSMASLQAGGTVNLSANCTSPDSIPVLVTNWTASGGTVSSTGGSATLSTAGALPGAIAVSATCTDSRGLNAQASTEVMVENAPPPQPSPESEVTEVRLALHSIYFPTDLPRVENPDAGLVASQQQTLVALAADFKKYLGSKPEAHLLLEGHTDPRGRTQYDQKLSERRAELVKSFLAEQGIPEANIETAAFGARHALRETAVKSAIENYPQLSPEERQRALSNLETIVLASDRRVDVVLSTTGESSVRQFPLNAADALTLIGGREDEVAKKPAESWLKTVAHKHRP